MVLLNTRKTAVVGGLLICLPVLFIIGLVASKYMDVDLKAHTFIYDWVIQQENRYGNTSTLNWLIRLFFLLAPILAQMLSCLSSGPSH